MDGPRLLPHARVSLAVGLDAIVISSDEVLVRHGTRSKPAELLRDSDLHGVLGAIFDDLTSLPAVQLSSLLEKYETPDGDIAALLADLLAKGIVSLQDTAPEQQFLHYVYEGDTRLGAKRVALVGLGPLGTRIALSLLQSGVRHFTLIDRRAVDVTWRSLAPPGTHLASKVGRVAEGVATLLERPETSVFASVYAADDPAVASDLSDHDLVVVAFEQRGLTVPHLINRICLRMDTPWLLVEMDGAEAHVGPLFVPRRTACFNEYQLLFEAGLKGRGMLDVERRHLRARRVGGFFVGRPPTADIVAGYAAQAAVTTLLTGSCFALGRVVTQNFDTMDIDLEDLWKLPRCPVCGPSDPLPRPVLGSVLRADEG